jgi:hypothetical protein
VAKSRVCATIGVISAQLPSALVRIGGHGRGLFGSHMPLRSGLPPARGAGAVRFGEPSALRGTLGVGTSNHWAASGNAAANRTVIVFTESP